MTRPSPVRPAPAGAPVLRIPHLVAAIGLPLLLAGCGEDTTPPSAPGAEAAPAAAARVSALKAGRTSFQIRDRAANASFLSVDPSGCVETFVFVFGARETVKEGPGKPTTGPLAVVQLSQLNFCTNEIAEFFGITGDATFEVSTQLDEARLRATVPGFVAGGVEAPAVVDLTWTGTGDLFSESNRYRLKAPGAMLTQWFKATFRPAQVSGTVMVGAENIAGDPLDALILRARQGSFEVVRTR